MRARRRPHEQKPHAPPVLDVCIHGQPVSSQSANRRSLEVWKNRVRSACIAALRDGSQPIDGPVRLQVTFYRESELGDVDNLLKPVQDALQDVAYGNDRQVSDATARRRDVNSAFKVRCMSHALARAFSDGRQFVHIEMWQDPDRETLG